MRYGPYRMTHTPSQITSNAYCIMYECIASSVQFMPHAPRWLTAAHRAHNAREVAIPVATSLSIATSDQKLQPKPCSAVFIASLVCLQVASMVAFVDAFLAASSHSLRV